MVIDTHAHFVPASFVEAARAQSARFPAAKVTIEEGKARFQFADAVPTRPMMPPMTDLDKRKTWMREQGIDMQVVGGWLDMFGYEMPGAEGVAWSTLFNEHIIAATREHHEIVPLATVPMQDGAAAAEVLKEAMRAGFSGAMIGAQPTGAGGNLDDAGLDPFWASASDLGAVVVVHPMYANSDARVLDYQMINAVFRITDVTTAIARLLYSGHLLKYGGVKMVASTGGGALPYILGRLKRNSAIHPGKWADPAEGFKKLYFDAMVFEADALNYLIKMAGADHIVLGSDYPFPIGDPEPLKSLRGFGLGHAEEKAICETTATELFGLA